MGTILTFDLGTTRLKVAVFNLEGELLGQVAVRNIEYEDRDKRWQSANDWWNHLTKATAGLLKNCNIDAGQIVGCSLSGRGGAAVFLDTTGQVLIEPWSDTRHTQHLAAMLKGRDRRDVALYGAMLASKLLWARDNQPQLADRTRHLLCAKDFILYRLTGEAVTDPASGPDGLAWDETLLAEFDIPAEVLPRPALPWTIGGTLTPQAAAELGLKPGIPVAVGAHDGICANAGAGAVSAGQYAITLGTNAVVRAVTDKVPHNSRRFYGLPPDKHIIGGNAVMAGRSLDWFVDNWFDTHEESRRQRFEDLDRQAGSIAPGANGIVFLPFLSTRAAFHGLNIATTRAAMYRAVMEGASFALARIFEQVTSWVDPTYIGVTGSGARSDVWTQTISDVLQQPLSLTDGSSEGRGAAMFCAMALNHFSSLEEASSSWVQVSRQVEPNADLATVYRDIRDQWQAFDDATRSLH